MLITMVHIILMFQPSAKAKPGPDRDDEYCRREIKFLDGRTVKLKARYYAITKSYTDNGGYQIAYYCDKCKSDWDKHKNL